MPLYFTDVILTTDNGVGGKKFRGAQVIGVGASDLTLKIHLEASVIGTRVVPKSLSPHSIVGDAKAVEVVGTNPDDFVVVAVYDAAFANAGSSNDITKGFFPGQIPEALHGQPKRLHWRSGRRNERAWQG